LKVAKANPHGKVIIEDITIVINENVNKSHIKSWKGTVTQFIGVLKDLSGGEIIDKNPVIDSFDTFSGNVMFTNNSTYIYLVIIGILLYLWYNGNYKSILKKIFNFINKIISP
jgi:hypothetical protein